VGGWLMVQCACSRQSQASGTPCRVQLQSRLTAGMLGERAPGCRVAACRLEALQAHSEPTTCQVMQQWLTAGCAVFSADQGDGGFACRHCWECRACRSGRGDVHEGRVAAPESGAPDLPRDSPQADGGPNASLNPLVILHAGSPMPISTAASSRPVSRPALEVFIVGDTLQATTLLLCIRCLRILQCDNKNTGIIISSSGRTQVSRRDAGRAELAPPLCGAQVDPRGLAARMKPGPRENCFAVKVHSEQDYAGDDSHSRNIAAGAPARPCKCSPQCGRAETQGGTQLCAPH
jgi:hypothetical protein